MFTNYCLKKILTESDKKQFINISCLYFLLSYLILYRALQCTVLEPLYYIVLEKLHTSNLCI